MRTPAWLAISTPMSKQAALAIWRGLARRFAADYMLIQAALGKPPA